MSRPKLEYVQTWSSTAEADEWHRAHGFRPVKRKANPVARASKPIEELSGPELLRRLDAADRVASQLNQELIDAGRGWEKSSETWEKNDPLSSRWKGAMVAWQKLNTERQRRETYHGSVRPIKRKENPVAKAAKKTAKKKPSAAQLAARREFAAIMKSGGFAAAKKARKSTRKKNPVAASPRTPTRTRTLSAASRPGYPAPAPAVKRTSSTLARKKNPIYPPARYELWTTNTAGRAERFVASFAHKGEAVAYGRIYANSKRKQVGVIIRGKAR